MIKKFILIFILSIPICTFPKSFIKPLNKKRSTQIKTMPKKGNEIGKLMRSNEKLKELLLRTESQLKKKNKERVFLTGTVFKGIILNQIRSSGSPSPTSIRVYSNQGLPFGSRFDCLAQTEMRRVLLICSKLILPKSEITSQALGLNLSGALGLTGEILDDSESQIESQGTSELLNSALEGAESTVRNTGVTGGVYRGLFGLSKKATEIGLARNNESEPVVLIEAGREVLIYLKEKIHVR